jgi:hypothetical protein
VNQSGTITNIAGMYEDIGGGVSYYIGRNFGIRPEFRYEAQTLFHSSGTEGINRLLASGTVFFQFGGRAKKK